MIDFIINANNLAKSFDGRNFLFKDITFTIANGESLVVTGINGSGKSTLLKIIAGVVTPSKGEVIYMSGNNKIESSNWHEHICFVSPYLNLYEEFTPLEHLQIFAEIQGIKYDEEFAKTNLEKVGIYKARKREIKKFSSGMKQRMKFALALQRPGQLFFMDEPTSNLDKEGIETVEKIFAEHISNGGAVLIASNEDREIKLCDKLIDIQQQN